MATNKREIVYYKGKPYYIEEDKGTLIRLEDVSKSSVTILVEKSNILTEEQFNNQKVPFGYINYTI